MERIEDGEKVEWVSQNSFYYFLRKKLLKNGINPDAEGKLFRKSLTRGITEWCEQLKTTREDFNIYASSRAYLYFRGKRTAVSLRSIENLALDGTDIIVIEKEDVAEVIQPYTNAAGIAILDTKGYAVLYARRLSRLAKKNGCNIAMITDLDADGILMTIKVKQEITSLFRIGINFKMLKHFGIDADVAGETYSGKAMKTLDQRFVDQDIATVEELEFIRSVRIEIDSVITEVSDNKKFADYVIQTLVKKFETRDYNRAIEVKDYGFPTIVQDLERVLRNMSKPIVKYKVDKTIEGLQEYKGIIDDVEVEEETYDTQLTEQLDLLVADGPQGEQIEDNFIKLVNGIQALVNEFDSEELQDE